MNRTGREHDMDRSVSAGFEGITQLLLEQKKIMDALEAENRELRRQLADLRRGVGISIVIDGQTLPLSSASERTTNPLTSLSAPSPFPAAANVVATGYNAPTRDEQFGRKTPSERRENVIVHSPLADSFVL